VPETQPVGAKEQVLDPEAAEKVLVLCTIPVSLVSDNWMIYVVEMFPCLMGPAGEQMNPHQ
jgi:hypothetical protein